LLAHVGLIVAVIHTSLGFVGHEQYSHPGATTKVGPCGVNWASGNEWVAKYTR